MSVLTENEVGWLVDHQRQINSAYIMTCIFENYRLSDNYLKVPDFIYGRQVGCSVCQFKVLPELFAIHQSFMMDTQFSTLKKTYQAAVNSDVIAKNFDMPQCDLVHESADACVTPSLKSRVNIICEFFCNSCNLCI